MQECCEHCGSPYLSNTAFLVMKGRKQAVEHMAMCQKCNVPLGRLAARRYFGMLGKYVSFYQRWPDEILGETLNIDAKAPHYPVDETFNVYRLFPLEKESNRRSIGSRWSATLMPKGRSMMARALMTVRREMRQEKIERISKVFAHMGQGSL